MGLFNGLRRPNVDKLINNRDIEGLIKATKYSEKAIDALVAMKVIEVIDIIIARLDSDEIKTRKDTIFKLWKIRDDEWFDDSWNDKCVDGLLIALNDDHGEVRRLTTSYLGDFDNTKAFRGLIVALKDKDRFVRQYAVESLNEVKWLSKDKPDICYTLIDRKELSYTDNLVDKLIEIAINSEDYLFQVDTIRILGKIGNNNAIKGLEKFLDIGSDQALKTAASILVKRINEIYVEDNPEKFKDDFKASEEYIYIENFAKRFKFQYDKEQLKKLNILLSHKGINIPKIELKKLVEEEVIKQIFMEFRDSITYNNPKELKDFVNNLFAIYGDNYQSYLDPFEIVLQENNIDYSRKKINKIIINTKKEMEISSFEEELLYGKPSFSIENIDQLDGHQFEGLLEILFKKMGYYVENTSLSGDQGADLILSGSQGKIVVQAKCYSNKVGNKSVQEVVAAIAFYNANSGIVATNNEFTSSAIELAKANNIMLIDRSFLSNLIERYPVNFDEL